MGELLTRLSGDRLEATLLWTLTDWEKRYGEVSLYEGIVLSLSPERCYLVEAEPVASLVKRVLAPGVFFLSAKGPGTPPPLDMEAAVEALRKAGVDIVARYGNNAFWPEDPPDNSSPTQARPGDESPVRGSPFSAGFPSRRRSLELEGKGKPVKVSPAEAESLKEQFHTTLDGLGLSKAERDELSSRIERRLVLSGTQLSGASVRYEKLEARGLDYVGKALIAKQALATGSLVEVNWSGGGTGRIFGIPVAIEKQGQESVLVLEPSASRPETPGAAAGASRERLHIPLGKISLLRRIKKSIFEA
jgi:hypothetical protein